MIGRAARRFSSKLYKTGEEALKDAKDGAKITFAGFGVAGVAENCLRIVHNMGLKNLTLCSNSMGLPGWGPGVLVDHHQISKITTCFIGGNPSTEKQYLNGNIEIEYMPQGSLVDRIHACQAGMGGFFSHTGVATSFEEGGFPTKFRPDGSAEKVTQKFEKRVINGVEYLLYPAYEKSDFVFIKAFVADKYGNLRYRRAARNFNPNIAGAGHVTIAEAEYIVDRLPPEKVHTPGCMVDRVFQGDIFTHKVERLKIRDSNEGTGKRGPPKSAREKILRRAVKEFVLGMYVNMGVGMPAEVTTFIPDEMEVNIQVENGLVGGSKYPFFDEIDPDTINASKEPITVKPGFSISCSSASFGMMRGKHIHMTILGGFQVSETGDLANWAIPGQKAKGMGGAMDLAASCPRVLITMEHCAKNNAPRILPRCTYPLTAKGCVTKLITELAVFEFRNGKMILLEKDKSLSLDALKKITPAHYDVSPNLKDYQID